MIEWNSVESIASESTENLEKIEGFDNELANEIILRSSNYIKEQDEKDKKTVTEKIKDSELINLEGMNIKMLALLAKENILTLNDFADLASFELIDKDEGIFKNIDIDEEKVNKMIMKARENWFADEK